jgi:hypothetical protein
VGYGWLIDYACVFVIGLDWLEYTRWTEKQIRNLTYVAITMAWVRLYVPHVFGLALAQ